MFDWYTSDWHLNHANVIEFSKRSHADARAMNMDLIQRFNARVKPTDTVAMLGDFAFGAFTDAHEMLGQLNGHITLVRGNHDRSETRMRALGFHLVVERIHGHIGGHRVVLSHYPPADTPYGNDGGKDVRFAKRRPVLARGEVCIHGHTHAVKKRIGQCVHVGVDAWGMCPAPAAKVTQLVQMAAGA